jgi:hypothetical protein
MWGLIGGAGRHIAAQNCSEHYKNAGKNYAELK